MSLAVQAQIRRNAEEVRAYLSDLREWEESFSKEEKSKKQTKYEASEASQQPETSETGQSSKQQQQAKQKQQEQQQQPEQQQQQASNAAANRRKYARDLNSLPEYYKAWDAFDPDKEEEEEAPKGGPLAKSQQKVQKAHPQVARGSRNGAHSSSGAPRMRVCASVPSSGKVGSPEKAPLGAPEGASGGLCGGPRASSSAAGPTDWLAYLAALKEAANRNFGAKRYAAAVKEYTKVLQLVEEYLARLGSVPAAAAAAAAATGTTAREPAAAAETLMGQLYGNRAAAYFYLKKYTECISDCSKALQQTPNYAKLVYRRGAAWAAKGQPEEALKDLNYALQIVRQQLEQQKEEPWKSQQQKQQQEEQREDQGSQQQDEQSGDQRQKQQQEEQSEDQQQQQEQQQAGVCVAVSLSAADALTSLAEKIESEIKAIREKTEMERKEREQTAKDQLLLSLTNSICRFPEEPLRPLDVCAVKYN